MEKCMREYDPLKTTRAGPLSDVPSAMAVLPTPGSPINTGLFLVRRERIWIARLKCQYN